MSGPDLDEHDDPGGRLLVTPSGSTVVSTDALLTSAERLRALELALHADLRRVVAADDIGMPLDGIVPAIERARELCESGRDLLARVAENYTSTETLVEGVQRDIAALIAATLGPAALQLFARLVVFFPGALIGGALLGWGAIPDHGDGKLAALREFMMAHPELITSPEFVRFVSLVSTSIDDAALGLAGMPGWLAPMPGTELSGNGGVEAGALTVASLGAVFGMFRESPVAVDRVSTSTLAAPPSGVRDRFDRIPEVDQVRVEKYEAPGMPPRYAVYIGPTETFSPYDTEKEPFDLTSNVVGVAGLSAGSLRSVEAAMAEAGIRPSDEVVVSGFSQGGLIATLVAASGDWNVVGMETHGAPAGNVRLPDGISGLAVRNTDDFVPALAGPQLDHQLVQVQREAFAGDALLPTDQAAPAHQRTAYERTADAIDGADSAVVREQVRTLDAFATDYLDQPGSRATVVTYHATRVG